MLDNFAVFITTHGRPDNVKTYRTLRNCGYTGPIYLIVDNEDSTIEKYQENYGDEVIVFDKLAAAQYTDVGDNIPNRKAVVFARNACFDIAEDLGIEYFLQVDDDYTSFEHKFDHEYHYFVSEIKINNLDKVFHTMLEYYKSIDAHCLAFAQSGDFIGGSQSSNAKRIWAKRKVMNTFFLSTLRRFDFLGRMNDDVNAYVSHGLRGKLMFSIMQMQIKQEPTQAESGGMTELYRDSGTYQKTFYSVMYAPSCVRVHWLGYNHRRIHHNIKWVNAVPMIIREEHRKINQVVK